MVTFLLSSPLLTFYYGEINEGGFGLPDFYVYKKVDFAANIQELHLRDFYNWFSCVEEKQLWVYKLSTFQSNQSYSCILKWGFGYLLPTC